MSLFFILLYHVVSAKEPATEVRLFLPLAAGGNACGDVVDTFDTAGNWFTGERDGLRAEIVEGEYRMEIARPGHVWMVGAPGCGQHDYRAEVDARWAGAPGNFYGLLYGIDGGFAGAHLLAVNSESQVWLVMAVRDDGLDFLVGPTYHEAILPGGAINRLAAERVGERVVLSINGAAVGELPDPTPGRPVVAGLVAATYTFHAPAEARFDNFNFRAGGGRAGQRGSGGAGERASPLVEGRMAR